MKLRIATALLAGMLVYPAPGVAQLGLPDRSGVSVRITPEIGLMTPSTWFYYEVTVLGQGPMEWTEAAILRATTLGLAVELDLTGSGIWLRGHVNRTVGGDTYLAYSVLQEALPDPPSVDRTEYWIPSTITMAGIDVGFPTRFMLPLGIQPYFTAGIGAKHYAFDPTPLVDNARAVAPEGGTVLMGRLGAGLMVPVRSGLSLDLSVRDAVSEYWDEDLQHDVLWTAGLSWQAY